jgi:hypothetical protein
MISEYEDMSANPLPSCVLSTGPVYPFLVRRCSYHRPVYWTCHWTSPTTLRSPRSPGAPR